MSVEPLSAALQLALQAESCVCQEDFLALIVAVPDCDHTLNLSLNLDRLAHQYFDLNCDHTLNLSMNLDRLADRLTENAAKSR